MKTLRRTMLDLRKTRMVPSEEEKKVRNCNHIDHQLMHGSFRAPKNRLFEHVFSVFLMCELSFYNSKFIYFKELQSISMPSVSFESSSFQLDPFSWAVQNIKDSPSLASPSLDCIDHYYFEGWGDSWGPLLLLLIFQETFSSRRLFRQANLTS